MSAAIKWSIGILVVVVVVWFVFFREKKDAQTITTPSGGQVKSNKMTPADMAPPLTKLDMVNALGVG